MCDDIFYLTQLTTNARQGLVGTGLITSLRVSELVLARVQVVCVHETGLIGPQEKPDSHVLNFYVQKPVIVKMITQFCV